MGKSKYWRFATSQQLWLHSSMAVSRENKLPPSFLDFKSQRVLYESSHDGVSRIENDEQSLNRSASVSHLWLLKAFFWFQNGSMILKTLTFADYCKQSYLWQVGVKSILAHFHVFSWMMFKALVLKKFEFEKGSSLFQPISWMN